MTKLNIFFGAIIIILPMSAHAYIGPGTALGAIISSLGILLGLLLVLLALIYKPIKLLILKLKKQKK